MKIEKFPNAKVEVQVAEISNVKLVKNQKLSQNPDDLWKEGRIKIELTVDFLSAHCEGLTESQLAIEVIDKLRQIKS